MEAVQSKHGQSFGLLSSSSDKHSVLHVQREIRVQKGINMWIIFHVLSSVGEKSCEM